MSTVVVKTLDAAWRAKLEAQVQRLVEAPSSQVDIKSGTEFVFVAHFDGTRNDRENLKLSGNRYPTNVGRLYELMKPRTEGNPNFETYYYPGVGTNRKDWGITRLAKSAFGHLELV